MLKRLLAVVAMLAAMAGCTTNPNSSESPTPTPSPTPKPNVATLAVGDCTGQFNPGSTDVQKIPCTAAHSWEVYALVPLKTQVLPDDALLESTAGEGCLASFASYVGVEPALSRYSAVYIVPDAAAWEDPDQRRIVCLAGSAQGGLTGTAKGDSNLFPDIGECTGPQDVPVLELAIIDCAASHNYEVYAQKKVKTTSAPTAAELQKLLKDVCVAEFKDYVGVDLSKSKYEYSYFIASSELWKKVADHRLVCSVGSPSGGIKGSLKGTGK